MPFPPPVGSFVIDFRGLDIVRGRDCVLFSKGDAHVVTIGDDMLAGGWPGGQGVQWIDSNEADAPEAVVTYSSGLYGGFMLWGSDESADQYVSSTRSALTYKVGVMMAGNAILSTSSYEKYTYASRIAGPLVPLVYQPKDPLYFSLRGLWTKEDELTLVGSPLAPAFFTGFTIQPPMPINQFFLGVQSSL
jgi:hypothetical protein